MQLRAYDYLVFLECMQEYVLSVLKIPYREIMPCIILWSVHNYLSVSVGVILYKWRPYRVARVVSWNRFSDVRHTSSLPSDSFPSNKGFPDNRYTF